MRGYENAVFEYSYLKKILYLSLAVLVIIIITTYYLQDYIQRSVQSLQLDEEFTMPEPHNSVNRVSYIITFLLPISILLKLLLEHARKHFRFYYANACFKIINETKSETDKTRYLSLGLDWYNKFINRVTKSSIDTETIYSKIISHSQLSNNILLDIIMDSFHNRDGLKPTRHMLALLSCWKEGLTLVKGSLRTKIRESSDLLIPIITVVITIITAFFLPR